MNERVSSDTYNIDQILEDLRAAIDEHFIRMANVHHGLFYPESVEKSEQELVYKNDPFLILSGKISASDRLRTNQIAHLKELYDKLARETRNLLQKSLHKQFKPNPEEFKSLLILSDEFLSRLNNLEKDVVREDSGIDPLTGLRSSHVVIDDLKRELSRTARRGGYFAIALARMDHFDHLKSICAQDELSQLHVEFAKLFKLSMRLYDDAYLLEPGFFVFCLKHTDHSGSMAAVERILRLLNEKRTNEGENSPFIKNGEALSLSFIVANPEQEESVETLLNTLKETLGEHKDEGELVLEQKEMTQLERYMKGMGNS